MSAPAFAEPTAPSRPRSWWVTALAWVVIALGGVGTPLSFLALIMSVSHHYGSSGTVGGFLTIVVAPPATLVAGICLLLRMRWARYFLIALSAFVLGWNLVQIPNRPPPEQVTISPSGVKTTTFSVGVGFFVPFVVVSAVVLAWLFLPPVRADFARPRRPPPLPGGL